MDPIKNLVYLDEYKMYSISSQIFGGLTDFLVDFHHEGGENKEQQSGPFASGKVLASILTSGTSTGERRFLHDYSYTLFESALDKAGKVLDVSNLSHAEIPESLESANFVVVRGKAIFHDMRAIDTILSNFNRLGEALAYVTAFSSGREDVVDNGPESSGSNSKRQAQIQEAARRQAVSKRRADCRSVH